MVTLCKRGSWFLLNRLRKVEITIGENAASLGVLRVPAANGQRMAHKNKYGREHDDPAPNNSFQEQQR